jgi:hypothetical protein
VPAPAELAGQALSRVVAALQPAVGVCWDERQRVDGRSSDGLGDELSGEHGEPTEAALLPGADQLARGLVVGDGRARSREAEATAAALTAAGDRPSGWRAAALAARALQ